MYHPICQTACQLPRGNIWELEKRMVLISVLVTDFYHRLKTDKWTNLRCVLYKCTLEGCYMTRRVGLHICHMHKIYLLICPAQ